MNVIKRNGKSQKVSFDKILWRLQSLKAKEPKLNCIDVVPISQKLVNQLYDGINTSQLDELGAEMCAANITKHPEFSVLASRLIVSNNHKLTSPSLSETTYILYNNKDKFGNHIPLVSKDLYNVVMNNREKLNSAINYNLDYGFDYFGFKTLERAYLINIDGKTIERIQHMLMRVALGLHGDCIDLVLETYNHMANKYFTHATPTLFHSGTERPQLLSCFLLGIEDSVDGIYKTISDCAKISKWAGGIGIWAHDIRASNSHIKSTNGKSNGILPMLKVLNATAKHINQSGKRNGSFAIYLADYHADIYDFLEAKKNHGDEEARARDLFYAIWISDLFMKRVKENSYWSLMCPNIAKNLSNKYGLEFEKLYLKYESDDKYVIQRVKARELWEKILVSQIETGTPYILYKDSCNEKSNQKNIGTIKSSNLCTEIVEYSDNEQYACCTLGSIGLPKFVEKYDYSKINDVIVFTKDDCIFCERTKTYLKNKNIKYNEKCVNEEKKYLDNLLPNDIEVKTVPQIFINYKDNSDYKYIGGFDELMVFFKPKFNFNKLYEVTQILTNNLDKVIDINYYPVPETRYSNKLHRPIGIGVQGLSDVYSLMRVGFDSDEARLINKQIFATIYYASLNKSMIISKSRKDDMLKIRDLRKNSSRNFIKANQYTKSGNNYIFNTGTTNSVDLNNNSELFNLENKLLPIDEELYDNNDINNYKPEKYLGSYSSFIGSPLSKGLFQFDLWYQEPLQSVPGLDFDWETLRKDISEHGIRNSLLVAPMPTASTSQILGNTECIEPITSNIFSRNTLAGSFVIVNKHLLKDLISINLWNPDIKNKIITEGGSIQNIDIIPDVFKNIYKTAWDISQKSIIDQSADRGIYICQSQSLNLFLKNPDFSKLSSMHMYTHSKGLKTGIYYLRTKAVAKAQQFTIEPEKKSDCEMCSA